MGIGEHALLQHILADDRRLKVYTAVTDKDKVKIGKARHWACLLPLYSCWKK